MHEQRRHADRESGFLDVETLEEVAHGRYREQTDGDAIGDTAVAGDAAPEQDERDAEQRGRAHGDVRDLGREGVADDVESYAELGRDRRDDVDDAHASDCEAEQPQPTSHRRRTAGDPRDHRGSSLVHDFSPVLFLPPVLLARLTRLYSDEPEPDARAMRGR